MWRLLQCYLTDCLIKQNETFCEGLYRELKKKDFIFLKKYSQSNLTTSATMFSAALG